LTNSRLSLYHRLMHKVVTTAQMREIDRLTTEKFGIPSLQLMENAGQAVVDWVRDFFGKTTGDNVLVVCGPGNNGGDGAAIARILADDGMRVTAVLTKKLADTKGDARTNLADLKAMSERPGGSLSFFECPDESNWDDFERLHDDSEPDLIVDALFGTGLTRPLTGVFASAVEYINDRDSLHTTVVSVDIPSGLNSDDNSVLEICVEADFTVSFTAPKLANVMPPASNMNGDLMIAQIGSPRSLIDDAESTVFETTQFEAIAFLFSTRYLPGSFKNSHGHALVVAGSRDYMGAPVLCGEAAMQSGAGLVTVATPASALFGVAPRLMPEVITAALAETDGGAVALEARHQVEKLAAKASVIAAGPGLTASDDSTKSFMRWLVETRRTPLVIDADGLNALAPWPKELKGTAELPLILTPHPGEMRHLLNVNDLGPRPWEAAARFAQEHQLILVLKGERSVVISPQGDVFINPTGNPGVGTAGAGDTMTGVIAGFIAQDVAGNSDRADVLNTVRAAVYICGFAADLAADDLGMRTMTASDIRRYLGAAMRRLALETEIP
jgi:hydroxyethylthiazole kinase-like uncharacterized protein yjeF